MRRSTRWIVGSAATAALLAGAGGLAVAGSDDDTEPQITGQALDRARAAALAYTGGGRVTDTEVGDEDGYYEVEVTLDDGRQVDVHLDQDFQVTGSKTDTGDGTEDGR